MTAQSAEPVYASVWRLPDLDADALTAAAVGKHAAFSLALDAWHR